jgi:hypothetical protein
MPPDTQRIVSRERRVGWSVSVLTEAANLGYSVAIADLNSLICREDSLFVEKFTLLIHLGKYLRSRCGDRGFWRRYCLRKLQNCGFPCKIPCLQGIWPETGAIITASPARQSLN